MNESSWPATPRMRLLIDNDFSGDPDGLVQLAQHALSPTVDIRAVIGSHLAAGDRWDPGTTTADNAASAARTTLELSGRSDVKVVAGSNTGLVDSKSPIATAGTEAIISEAMNDDSDLPLFLACGAGLTELASAWLIEPRIAERMTVVWIGGHEHDGLAEPPPNGTEMEYNLNIDPIAGQVVFNESDLSIWQVPRDMYRFVLASRSELAVRMLPFGPLGAHLYEELSSVLRQFSADGTPLGETYALGDSPLVLLTALMTPFQAAPASSLHVTIPCPRINERGLYEANPEGRPLRVYTQLDVRMLLEDLYAKLEMHARG